MKTLEQLGYEKWNQIHQYTLYRKEEDNRLYEISIDIINKLFTKYEIVSENNLIINAITLEEGKAIINILEAFGKSDESY